MTRASESNYERMRRLLQQEVFWSGGTDHPWDGDALTSPWLIDQLARLAAHAPEEAIAQFERDLSQ